MRAALMVMVLILGGCASVPAAGLHWTACGNGLECTTVTVPVDWSEPGGAVVDLEVARYPASAARSGSVFFNPGGPGLSGVDALRARGAELAELGGGRFDIVSWDPRGPLDERLLPHLSTTAGARDLDHLRGLVGDATLTFYGESYGSFLGQVYANMFPGRVRALVLDGAVDPVATTAGAEERLAASMADTTAVFTAFGRLCDDAGPRWCALADRGDVLTTLLHRLESTPMGALTYPDALVVLHNDLATPARWPEMARSLAEAADGDGTRMLRRARQVRAETTAAVLPAAATSCLDGPAQVSTGTWAARQSQFSALSPIAGPLLTWWAWAPCAAWPVRGAEVYPGPWSADTPNPVLVIGTTLDPVTPYRDARTVTDLLGNAILLTHQGFGHTSANDPSVCVTAAVTDYLVNLRAPSDGTVCRSDRLPFSGS